MSSPIRINLESIGFPGHQDLFFSQLLKISENGLFEMLRFLTRSLTNYPNSVSIDQLKNNPIECWRTNLIKPPFLRPAVNLFFFFPRNVSYLNVCIVKKSDRIFYRIFFSRVWQSRARRTGGWGLTQFVRSPFSRSGCDL